MMHDLLNDKRLKKLTGEFVSIMEDSLLQARQKINELPNGPEKSKLLGIMTKIKDKNANHSELLKELNGIINGFKS
jgi:hypothetical protein